MADYIPSSERAKIVWLYHFAVWMGSYGLSHGFTLGEVCALVSTVLQARLAVDIEREIVVWSFRLNLMGSILSPSASYHTASIVEGGFDAILYVTLTTPGTCSTISRESVSRISKESRVGDAVRASTLSQQRTSICWPKSRLPSRMPVTRSS